MHEYETLRRVVYGTSDDSEGEAYFVPVCPTCARFVKADDTSAMNGSPNATCSRCGRVTMLFEGYL